MDVMFRAIVVLLAFSSVKSYGKEAIYLYTYHLKPPFVININDETGLYYDLSKSLSRHSEQYEFKTVFIPRKRLDHMIKRKALDGLVIGVSPNWFKDVSESKFVWSASFYQDKDEFVSLKSQPFDYQGQASLYGKVLGSVAGYYYFGINEAVRNERLVRVDSVGELQVLQFIKKQRVDIGIVSQSVFKYLVKNGDIDNTFHISAIPHDEFARRAFAMEEKKLQLQEFERLVAHIRENGELDSLISEYQ